MKPIETNAAPLKVTAAGELVPARLMDQECEGGDDHGHGSSADASPFDRKSHGNVEPVRVASDPNQRMGHFMANGVLHGSHNPGCR